MIANYLILSAALFAIGLYGVLSRRNLIVVLMSVEVMINGAALSFAAVARGGTLAAALPDHSGQIFVLLTMAVAAAEAAVGLAILILLFRARRGVSADDATAMWG